MYFELAKIGADSVGSPAAWPYESLKTKEELIALSCEMSRFDPRLFNILVLYFIHHWHEINPTKLRNCYRRMKYLQTTAVISEFLKETAEDDEAVFFAEYLTAGLKPVPNQFYFHNLYEPGGRLSRRAAEEVLSEFKKWGFLACERPTIDLKKKKTAGSMDNISRRNALLRIWKKGGQSA